MNFKKKFFHLLIAALCLFPALAQPSIINGNLDVRGNIVGGVRTIGPTNLTLNLSGGSLSIRCGNAICSTSNPGWLTLPSNTAGQMQTFKITSAPSFQDDANVSDSDFVGNGTCSWGTTAGAAWPNNVPLLIGVVHDGTSPVFLLARGPVMATGASTNIGYKDNCPSSASQTNIIAMTSTDVTSTHANKAITWLGSVRATKSASDDWTFSTLDDGDGIGIFYNFGIRQFDMPTNQMGSSAGAYVSVSGGTPPTYTANNNSKYKVLLHTGETCHAFDHNNAAGGTAGAGANPINIATAFVAKNNTGLTSRAVGIAYNAGSLSAIVNAFIVENTSAIKLEYQSTIVDGREYVTGARQNNAVRNIAGNICYQAF